MVRNPTILTRSVALTLPEQLQLTAILPAPPGFLLSTRPILQHKQLLLRQWFQCLPPGNDKIAHIALGGRVPQPVLQREQLSK